MPSQQVILRADQLKRSFVSGVKSVPVLRGVSLELYRQELVLIMGSSGSGKSTLLSIISGLLHPDSGQVLVQGTDLWKLSDVPRRQLRQKQFGFIFQAHNLFPALTAREQLEMAACWVGGLGRLDARRKTAVMLDQLGLSGQAEELPAQLSGGEKQRVAIGRALIKSPAICFADEPTSSLDWNNGQKVMRLLAATVRDRGATVVVVAHDTRLIPFAQRVLEMEEGCLKVQEVVH